MTLRRMLMRPWLIAIVGLLIGCPLRAEEPSAPQTGSDSTGTVQLAAETPKPEPPAPNPAMEQARERFERGLQLARSNTWDAALAEFLASLELFPTRGALKNAALSLKELHRYDEALDSFETLLLRYPDLPAEERAEVEREMKELGVRVGFIDVRASEPGASVVVDGRARVAPAGGPIRVAVGSRLVRVHKEGFLSFEQRVDVAGAQTLVIAARLRPLIDAGRLRVGEASGKAAQVFVDGALMGKAPWEGTVATGSHVVWLAGAAPRSGTQPALVMVKRNQLAGLDLAVEPLEAVLRVEANPASSQISLDGVPITTGLWEGPVRGGGHLIEVASDGHLTAKRELSLGAGERRTVRVVLELDPESARFKAEHPARIVLDADFGVIATSAVGRDPAERCTGSCNRGLPVGIRGTIRGRYQLGIGLGISLDLGLVRLRQRVEGRKLDAQPVSQPPSPGTVDEDLSVSLWTVGASIFYHTGERFTLLARLGGGAAVGSFTDERNGGFAGIGSTNPGVVDYRVSERQSFSSPYVYGHAAVRLGYVVTEGLEIGVGLDGLLLVATKTAQWNPDDPESRFLAECAQSATTCTRRELAQFPNERLQSESVLGAGLGIGARYAF